MSYGYEHIVHPFDPVFDENSKILVLGSLPSVASRADGFYYGNHRNRLWRVLAALLNEPVPMSIEQKRGMLLRHGIAMWDVIYECDIRGSSDASVKHAVPIDLARITDVADIQHVYLNGNTAGRLYEKYLKTDCAYTILPSTSPANAAYTLEHLTDEWQRITDKLPH